MIISYVRMRTIADELAGMPNPKEAASVREFEWEFVAKGVYEGAVRK